MTTKITGSYLPAWHLEIETGSDHIAFSIKPSNGGKTSITVKTEDLLKALGAEGVITTQETLKMVSEIRKVVDLALESIGERNVVSSRYIREIDRLLNPEPPFIFPTGFTSVITGRYRSDGSPVKYVRIGSCWIDKYGTRYTEERIVELCAGLRVER